jgi:hypothetical protein
MREMMTITLEFDLGDRRIHLPHLKAGAIAATAATTAAIEKDLLEDSVATVRSHMAYGYRYTEIAEAQSESADPELDGDKDLRS